jgi:DUF4097 and DUF4098 domain-containing protein YvlB
MTEHEHGEGEAERLAREAERDARHAEREAERAARESGRDAAREARREERRERRRVRWYFGFGDMGAGMRSEGIPQGESDQREESEVVERRFDVTGMPKVRVRNVSGETAITVGAAGEVYVRARKRVHGWSEDRSRRLLENVEVRMEQRGDEILVEPTLYQQERGWLEMFRGGRVAVDLDIRVPREAQLDAQTVSGDLSVTGTRGPLETKSVSGEIGIEDVQGPLRLRVVSGDVRASAYAGQAEANSVSGEIRFERSRLRTPDIVTVSGDVEIDGTVGGGDPDVEGRIKTVSGDVSLALADGAIDIDFRTLSGDVEADLADARIEKQGRREWRIQAGGGGARLRVKTVSGDLSVRRSREPASAVPDEPTAEPTPAGGAAPEAAGRSDVMDLLQRVARGEISVDDASGALDQTRR